MRACSVDRHGNASSCRLFRPWRKEYLFPTTYKSYQNITTRGGYKWKILLPLNNISGVTSFEGSAASAVKWNMGRVTPLFKKEDEVYEKNNRPVTVLPIFNIYERVLSDQLWVYFKHFVLSDFISAHRNNYSCENTLLRLMHQLIPTAPCPLPG